jgi:hypothetical protein
MSNLKEKFGKFELSKEQAKMVNGGAKGGWMFECGGDLHSASTLEALYDYIYEHNIDANDCILAMADGVIQNP